MPAITHKINTPELRQLLHGRNGAVARDIYRRGHRVLTAAKLQAPVDTGRLRSSLSVVLIEVDGAPAALVGTNVRYARYVLRGTGLYGPHHQKIVPVRASVLVFTPRGGRKVFVRSVRGAPGRPFLQRALLAARG